MRRYKIYIFDLDGTIYRGDSALPRAVETLAQLRQDGSAIRFLTNNSGQTREFYTTKLRKMGFEVEPSEIFSSATGTVTVLQQNAISSVYAVGNPGLVATLESEGIRVVNRGPSGEVIPEGDPAGACVVGICHTFTYALLNGALQQVLQGAKFIATNRDATYPLEGRVIPGAGSIVASVCTCTGVEPFVVGKPNPFLVEQILREAGIDKADALVVGDRPDTDLEAGIAAHCDTHLVLTGVTAQAPTGQSASPDLSALL